MAAEVPLLLPSRWVYPPRAVFMGFEVVGSGGAVAEGAL